MVVCYLQCSTLFNNTARNLYDSERKVNGRVSVLNFDSFYVYSGLLTSFRSLQLSAGSFSDRRPN